MHIVPAKKIPLLSYPILDAFLVPVTKILLRLSHSPSFLYITYILMNLISSLICMKY